MFEPIDATSTVRRVLEDRVLLDGFEVICGYTNDENVFDSTGCTVAIESDKISCTCTGQEEVYAIYRRIGGGGLSKTLLIVAIVVPIGVCAIVAIVVSVVCCRRAKHKMMTPTPTGIPVADASVSQIVVKSN